jgi:hypothetical protein
LGAGTSPDWDDASFVLSAAPGQTTHLVRGEPPAHRWGVLWLSAVLTATIANLDNLTVGFAFGVRDIRIAVAARVVIAAVTMAGTAGAMTSGRAWTQGAKRHPETH